MHWYFGRILLLSFIHECQAFLSTQNQTKISLLRNLNSTAPTRATLLTNAMWHIKDNGHSYHLRKCIFGKKQTKQKPFFTAIWCWSSNSSFVTLFEYCISAKPLAKYLKQKMSWADINSHFLVFTIVNVTTKRTRTRRLLIALDSVAERGCPATLGIIQSVQMQCKKIFTELALWANSVFRLRCPYVVCATFCNIFNVLLLPFENVESQMGRSQKDF